MIVGILSPPQNQKQICRLTVTVSLEREQEQQKKEHHFVEKSQCFNQESR